MKHTDFNKAPLRLIAAAWNEDGQRYYDLTFLNLSSIESLISKFSDVLFDDGSDSSMVYRKDFMGKLSGSRLKAKNREAWDVLDTIFFRAAVMYTDELRDAEAKATAASQTYVPKYPDTSFGLSPKNYWN